MDKTGYQDQFYPALLAAIKNGEYENARALFNCSTNREIIYPDQISTLYYAIATSNMKNVHPQFYYQMSAFLSIYTDALKGALAFNDYYISCFKR